MVRLRHTLMEVASKYIMGASKSTEVWALIDRQFRNRSITIAQTITGLLTLKIPRGPGYKRVEVLLQCMRWA